MCCILQKCDNCQILLQGCRTHLLKPIKKIFAKFKTTAKTKIALNHEKARAADSKTTFFTFCK